MVDSRTDTARMLVLLRSQTMIHVPSDTGDGEQGTPYLIVPSFAHFRFPHNKLRPTWTISGLSLPPSDKDPPYKFSFENTVLTRDGSCRLTASTIGAEIARFISRTEDAWFATSFLEAGEPRRVVVRGKDGLPTAREVSGQDCRTMFTPSLPRSKSRSQSPKKRVQDNTAEDEDEDYGRDYGDGESDCVQSNTLRYALTGPAS
ncbi:hypothetical protein V2A60_008048 [Cordyceps javanica]